ncbi:MAG: acyltransferase family protein [Betaproteobacteria bacterium]|nr:acyltransferase family protein [Betaproteobacteria bacterium]
MNRRHDIDALRALAFGLLILYHLGMLYVSEWGWHLKSSHLSEFLQLPMLTVNRWRMDLIFLISGISAAFLLGNLQPGAFFRARCTRLLVPLVFGCLVIVPVQPYAQGVANGLVEPGYLQFLGRYFTGYAWPKGAFDGWQTSFTWNHLWYLVYLFVYTALLAALLPLFATRRGQAVRGAFTELSANLRGPRLLLWPAVLILMYTVLLGIHFPQNNALLGDWYAHAMYFTLFLFGYWIGRDEALWAEIRVLRRRSLAIALGSYLAYMGIRELLPDDPSPMSYLVVWVFRNLYVWTVLLAILGYGATYLNRPFKWLPWANEAVYPWYVLHQSLIVLLAYWLVPLKLGPLLEPLLVGGGTVLGCWALTSLVIARVRWLRPLFGLKREPPNARKAAGSDLPRTSMTA